MTLKEQLKEYGAKSHKIREDLLNKKLQMKYAAEYLRDNKIEFQEESKYLIDEMLLEYPLVKDYIYNHGPLCSSDCNPCKEAGAR